MVRKMFIVEYNDPHENASKFVDNTFSRVQMNIK